jgi:IclR family KDG regulon transcriptional repressor
VVEQDALSDKYRLGAKLVSYGTAANTQFDLRALAEPYLTRLRDATGETALLSVAADESALVVATVESNNPVCISVKPGNRVPIHSSAQGRIVLAWCDEATQGKFLKRKLQRFTDKSIIDPVQLRKRLAQIRERLYDDASGEVLAGVNVLAAPIFSAENELAGTIGIIGATGSVPSPPPEALLRTVQGTAAELSARLNSNMYAELERKLRAK